MESIGKIQEMLVNEVCNSLNNLDPNIKMDYYNELFGDTSFLLAGFLGQKLKSDYKDWDTEKWIDDSLFTRINLNLIKFSIWGVMIWGKEGTTEQWTEPFYFEVRLNENRSNFTRLTLLFSDLDNAEITYEEFNLNRSIWDKEYYSNENWDPSEKNWKYIINSMN